MNNFDLITKSLDILVENKLWKDRKPSEILKILMYVNDKKWLYSSIVDNEIRAIICAYRIQNVDEENLTKLPVTDVGNILYIPFVLSINKEDNIFRIIKESLSIYLENNPDIKEIVLENKNNRIKRFNIKGDCNGKKQAARASSPSNATV